MRGLAQPFRNYWNRLTQMKRHGQQAATVGCLAFVASLISGAPLAWMVVHVVGVRLAGVSWTDPKDVFNAYLAFAQVYGGLLALSLGAGFGWYALETFRREWVEPDLPALQVRFNQHPDLRERITKHYPAGELPVFRITLTAINEGKAVAVWFQVQITLGAGLGVTTTTEVLPHGGYTHLNATGIYTFLSQGRQGAFPAAALDLWQFDIIGAAARHNPHVVVPIEYIITTDKTPQVTGTLHIELIRTQDTLPRPPASAP